MGKTLAPKWNIIFLLISAIYLQTLAKTCD